jgi:prephenate dehydrogenase (NADP+)
MQIEQIGLIGLGDMGKPYAREFRRLGYNVCGCDLPEKRQQVEKELDGTGVEILDDGIAVSRKSDLIFYLVETENIGRVVEAYCKSTRKGAIVSSGTSVMGPAVQAFNDYLPKDIAIVNWHWMFGPSLKPQGRNSAWVQVRGSEQEYSRAREVCERVGTKIIEFESYQEHDMVTADTQAATHAGYESMGTAWMKTGRFPWENPRYVGGLDNVKVLMALRLFSGKPHLYSGLAILNPYARKQVKEYEISVTQLFEMMIQGREEDFRARIKRAGDQIFGKIESPVLLDDKVMGEFSLGAIPSGERAPNSNLSPLAMADTWCRLNINPYKNRICETPPFRLRLGIVEYLFRHPDLLEESIQAAMTNTDIRGDDLQFTIAASSWANVIGHQSLQGYKEQFEEVQHFFGEEKLAHGKQKSDELIKRL